MSDKEKVIKHSRYQTCNISKEKIDTEKDRYVILVDCNGDNIMDKGFYKLEYITELMKGQSSKIAESVMGRIQDQAGKMLERLGIAQPVYEITGEQR